MELRIISDTDSPSGKYAMAWGIPGVAKIDAIPKDKRWDIVAEKGKNYLVEKKTLKIVGQFSPEDDMGGFFSIDGIAPRNHPKLIWNPTEDTFLCEYPNKWEYEALYFAERTSKGYRFLNIGNNIRKFVVDKVRKDYPKQYYIDHKTDDRNPCVQLRPTKQSLFFPKRLLIPLSCFSIFGVWNKKDALGVAGIVELRVTSTIQRLTATPVRFIVKKTDDEGNFI
jgi:hypothetical protein